MQQWWALSSNFRFLVFFVFADLPIGNKERQQTGENDCDNTSNVDGGYGGVGPFPTLSCAIDTAGQLSFYIHIYKWQIRGKLPFCA